MRKWYNKIANFFHFVRDPKTQKDKLKNRLLTAIVFLAVTIAVVVMERLLEFQSKTIGFYSGWMTFFYSLLLLIDYIRYRLSHREEAPHDP